jgi:hypothetical protein
MSSKRANARHVPKIELWICWGYLLITLEVH